MQYFLDFDSYTDTSRKPGDPVIGYRIHYRTPEGKLYSPFMRPADYADSKTSRELEVNPTGVNHSLTDRGYYYWTSAKQAEEYLDFVLHKKIFRSSQLPRGEYIIQRVAGIDLGRREGIDLGRREGIDLGRREGHIMEDMQILDTYTLNP